MINMEEMALIIVYGGTILSVIAVLNSLVVGYIQKHYIIIKRKKKIIKTPIETKQEKDFNQYNNVL